MAWKGKYTVKNLLELKNARRVTITKNTFENVWDDRDNGGQKGLAILFTVRNQDGKSPWSTIEDVTFEDNTVKNAVAGMSNVQVLNAVDALNGRKLCENTVGLLEEKGVANWTSAGAVDKTEWVQQIRTLTTLFPPYQLQEDGHPNYWGQLALRNCVRQAYNGGVPRGGTCRIWTTGLNGYGEPVMSLS